MGQTLRAQPVGARVNRGLRAARPTNAVGGRSRKAGLLTRAPLWNVKEVMKQDKDIE